MTCRQIKNMVLSRRYSLHQFAFADDGRELDFEYHVRYLVQHDRVRNMPPSFEILPHILGTLFVG